MLRVFGKWFLIISLLYSNCETLRLPHNIYRSKHCNEFRSHEFVKSNTISLFAQALPSMDNNKLGALVTEAVAEHKTGNFEEALTKYKEALPYLQGKLASQIHSNTGAIYLNIIGDTENAKYHFEQSVLAQHENSQAHYNLAVLLTSNFNQHAKAIKHAKIALSQDPTLHKALHLLGNILQNMGRHEDAEKYFVQAEEMALANGQSAAAASGAGSGRVGASTVSTASAAASTNQPAMDLSSLPLHRMKRGETLSVVVNEKGESQEVSSDGDLMPGQRRLSVTCLSEGPLVVHIADFLNASECDHIIARAEPTLTPSFIMGGGGGAYESEGAASATSTTTTTAITTTTTAAASPSTAYRSSDNTWLAPGLLSPVLSHAQQRLAAVTGLPVAYLRQAGEQLQVVRYQEGGHFNVHQDSSAFHPRLLTALLYLNDVSPSEDLSSTSGATWFPYGGALEGESPVLDTTEHAIATALAQRAQSEEQASPLPGLVVRPKKGSAVIFFNHLPNGDLDVSAVHAGMPVLQTATGEPAVKWISNFWIGLDKSLLFQ